MKKSKNFTSRAPWIRNKLEYIITHNLIESVPGEIDVDAAVKEIMSHLGNRIRDHENRMYSRVSELEKTLGQIILKLQKQDPQSAQISSYLESISEQLFSEENLMKTLTTNIPARLVSLLKYEWYADYLADWIAVQEEYRTLEYDGNLIMWNEDRIREVYGRFFD